MKKMITEIENISEKIKEITKEKENEVEEYE